MLRLKDAIMTYEARKLEFNKKTVLIKCLSEPSFFDGQNYSVRYTTANLLRHSF